MINKRKLGLAGIATLGMLALAGCGPEPTMTIQTETERKLSPERGVGLNPDSQYTVKRVEVFQDDLAYNGKRGVYEIIDKKTGKKYIGISGVGIAELGSHSNGDHAVTDER